MDEKPRDHARLLSPEEIDGLEGSDNHELQDFSDRDSTEARLRSYEGSNAYSGNKGGGLYNSIMARMSPKAVRHGLIGVGVALLLILLASMMPAKKETIYKWVGGDSATSGVDGQLKIEKPPGIKIKGVIFYGRAQFVDILDCYLRKNLVVNGGLLDEILFMENTDKEADLDWLHKIVEEVPEYTRVPVEREGGHGWGGFNVMWSSLTEDDTIYLKIDDDIVWVDENAVPRMIQSLLSHPEAHDIAGNIINSPLTNWLHFHNEAVHPYLPEKAPPADLSSVQKDEWRVSGLPLYDGPLPDEYDFSHRDERPGSGFEVGQTGGPTYEGHRWLPLKNDSEHLMKTPIWKAAYDAFGLGWASWAIAAQQHYSLFENLEKNQLSRYYFGNGEGIWNMQYERYNLNFLAIWGKDVAKQLPGSDDEQDLTVTIPLKFHKPCLVDTRALIAHFNFGTQPELIHSDLLDRYRAYANEFVCAATNQKKKMPKPEKPTDVPQLR